ncbi:MAG: efflux RND transporter periplasmic adaptor subunit [Saprospiraceae bacterium]
MKYINYITSLSLLIGILMLTACAHDHCQEAGGSHDHEHSSHTHNTNAHAHDDGHSHGEGEHTDGEIFLTQAQMKTVSLQFGDFSNRKINDFVRATGTLGLPSNAYASISAKASGFIKGNKKYVEGSYVKAGVTVAYLESADFIKTQQAYLEVKAALVFLRQELARQEALVAANAGVLKNVQKLSAELNVKTATLKGIARQLSYLGIKEENIEPDNIIASIPITAPMSGYITSIEMHNGMYVEPTKELLEIVNETHLHLELDVFEKDIANVKEKQKISYQVPALGRTVYAGEINVIGKEFDATNKTVRIHGHLEKERPRFIKDLYIEAKIWLNDQTAQALPEKAVIKDGASSYIYVAKVEAAEEETQFMPIKVLPKLTEGGYTMVDLIDPIPDGMKIVTEGAYFVYAQSKAGELTHTH